MTPQISVVSATYNSSHLLAYALKALQRSTFEEWESIVVGDCCTDDTEDVVRALGDDRIRYINLGRNSGQQATPNNVGVALARGAYLAFLNQDDLFLPDHLALNVARLGDPNVDLVCSPYAEILPEQRTHLSDEQFCLQLEGLSPNGMFEPRRFHLASSWFMRRETADVVGPWQLEKKTFVTPSQDWLFRAWRCGVRISCPTEVSLVALYSGKREGAYLERVASEHAFIYDQIIGSTRLRPQFDAAVEAARQRQLRHSTPKHMRPWRAAQHALARIGVHPNTPRLFIQHGGPGGYIRDLKKITG